MEDKTKYKIKRRRSIKGGQFRKKICRFCKNKIVIDYKSIDLLRSFVSERGKITPRRISGNCARHQRQIAMAIKRARQIGLLPFANV